MFDSVNVTYVGSTGSHTLMRFTRLLANSDIAAFGCFSVLAAASLMLRIDNTSYIMESLWCEDSYLLINQAHALGVKSLWEPHAGYLHLYHRIVALVASAAPLVVTPVIYFCGWIAAFLLVVWVIAARSRELGLGRSTTLFVILAISLQPNNGEAFLNLGQSFYILAIALAIFVCLPSRRPPTLPGLFLLVLLSLSGPASEILAIVLVLRVALLRDFATRRAEYLVVWGCAAIQLFLTLQFDPWVQSRAGTSLNEWLRASSVFFSFGSTSQVSLAAAFVFWTITLYFLAGQLTSSAQSFPLRSSLLLMLLTAGAFFGAGAVRQGDYMVLMNPVDHESRYYVLPYAIAFFCSFIVTRHCRPAQFAVLFSLGLICGDAFLTLDRVGREGSTGLYRHEPLQWVAFNKFREAKPSIAIPTNPTWAMWPSYWEVKVPNKAAPRRSRIEPIQLDLAQLRSPNSALVYYDGHVQVSSPARSPRIIISLGNRCGGVEYLALEVDVWTSSPGWTRLYWSNAAEFTTTESLSRFYPAGTTTLQYAFRRDPPVRTLRLDLLGGVERWLMQDWAKKTRESILHASMVPPPTPPGGEARIQNLRLFCLE